MLWSGILIVAVTSTTWPAAAIPAPPSSFQQLRGPHLLKVLSLKDVNGGTTCAGCAVLLGLVGQLAEVHNASVDKALEMLCNYLPHPYSDLCGAVIEVIGPEAIQLLVEKETSDVVCHTIGLCRNDSGQFCHIFPLPKDESEEEVTLRVKNIRKRISLKNPDLFRKKVVETIGIKFCDFFKDICDAFEDHKPLFDDDGDLFSTEGTIRGYDWRGKDCNDDNKDIYPGRHTADDAKVDTNCNGIFGVDPTTNSTYESQWCDGTQQMGTVVLGDSASAHFHIPPSWLEAATMNGETFKDFLFILENELDWPMLSSVTGYANISKWSSSISGKVDSYYLRLHELNRCNHRDYQNIAVNGARASAMADGIVKTLARSPDTDNPAFVTLALIGNDVCNGHPNFDHMTKPNEMYSSTLETFQYLDQHLPSGSAVLVMGLVDGTVLYNILSKRIHPFGALRQDVTYADLYDYMNCLQVSPCFGWLNSNETVRNLTTKRAKELNKALQEAIGNFSSTKFKLHYIDPPLPQMIDVWVKEGHQAWELIEPVDGFHPTQIGQALTTELVFQMISQLDGFLPKPNPFNDKIKEKFGDQGGYGD